jgi:hypothetical protein
MHPEGVVRALTLQFRQQEAKMTFKIKMLIAAATIAFPAVASAQVTGATGTATNPARGAQQATPPVQSTTNAADQTVRQTPDTADQATPPAADSDAAPPADQATQPPQQAQTNAQAGAQAQPGAQASTVTAATAADVHTGVAVHDTQGGMVGTVESADASGAVVNTGAARARLPLTSFARNDQGLIISMTKSQLEAAARPQQNPT